MNSSVTYHSVGVCWCRGVGSSLTVGTFFSLSERSTARSQRRAESQSILVFKRRMISTSMLRAA